MRIPILFNPINKRKYFLHIERAYKSKKEVIPLGSDCHTAYILKKLHLRKQSLPFDFMGTGGIRSFDFINDNIDNQFKYFSKDYILNEKGIVSLEKYPYCTFLHFPDLIDNVNLQKKFTERASRFINIINNTPIHFINNIPSIHIKDYESVKHYTNTVYTFVSKYLKKEDLLSIYIRFDESFEENRDLCNLLHSELNQIEKVKCVKYIRYNNKYPTWGNPKYWPKLLYDLNVDIKKAFPKIFIKKS